MDVSLLKCKIHRARVTECHLDYEGSCAIDEDLMEAAGLHEFEEIHIWNVNNGARFTTYAIRGERGSGMISINGSAARMAEINDFVIIAAFARVPEAQARAHQPRLVYINGSEGNRIVGVGQQIPAQAA
ncbi:aspartate 1-decarboxylase [Magnetofaba australis]|nr:aspartate 1-decarboxylase [Magnetofaba australis]